MTDAPTPTKADMVLVNVMVHPFTNKEGRQEIAQAIANARVEAEPHWKIIKELTENEAEVVTIIAENADGTGPDNHAVILCGDSTDWKEVRYYGDTALEALENALKARGKAND